MAMEAGVGPVFYLLDQPMFDRIVVQVVEMPLQVFSITNLVFPVAPLPEAFFAFLPLALG